MVSDILARDGKLVNLFLRCILRSFSILRRKDILQLIAYFRRNIRTSRLFQRRNVFRILIYCNYWPISEGEHSNFCLFRTEGISAIFCLFLIGGRKLELIPGKIYSTLRDNLTRFDEFGLYNVHTLYM